MTILRILNLVIWGAMALYMLPGAWSALFGRSQRRGDAMRLACLATGLVMAGHCARWLVAPDSDALFQLLYVGGAGTGLYILWLSHAYGRGPRV